MDNNVDNAAVSLDAYAMYRISFFPVGSSSDGGRHNVRARHPDGIVIAHSGYQLHIITDIPPDTVVSELTRLFLDVFADPN